MFLSLHFLVCGLIVMSRHLARVGTCLRSILGQQAGKASSFLGPSSFICSFHKHWKETPRYAREDFLQVLLVSALDNIRWNSHISHTGFSVLFQLGSFFLRIVYIIKAVMCRQKWYSYLVISLRTRWPTSLFYAWVIDDDDTHPISFLLWGSEMRCPIFPNRSMTKYQHAAVLMAEQSVLMIISCFCSLFLR